MDSTTFGIMLLYFLMPGHLEYLLNSACGCGNMGMYGVYMDIYRKRNLVYSSPILVGMGILFGKPMYSIAICIAILISFIYTSYKWHVVVFNAPINKIM